MHASRRVGLSSHHAVERFRQAMPALALLWRRTRAADEPIVETWEFARAADVLAATGCAADDLQWLIDAGYVTSAGVAGGATPAGKRRQAPVNGETFVAVTRAGAAVMAGVLTAVDSTGVELLRQDENGQLTPIPHWDARRRELRYRGTLVKRFVKAAPNQECILEAFERQHGPNCE